MQRWMALTWPRQVRRVMRCPLSRHCEMHTTIGCMANVDALLLQVCMRRHLRRQNCSTGSGNQQYDAGRLNLSTASKLVGSPCVILCQVFVLEFANFVFPFATTTTNTNSERVVAGQECWFRTSRRYFLDKWTESVGVKFTKSKLEMKIK